MKRCLPGRGLHAGHGARELSRSSVFGERVSAVPGPRHGISEELQAKHLVGRPASKPTWPCGCRHSATLEDTKEHQTSRVEDSLDRSGSPHVMHVQKASAVMVFGNPASKHRESHHHPQILAQPL